MSYDHTILYRATARLDARRRERNAERDALRQQIYQRDPRIKALDRRLQATMSDLIANCLRRGEKAGDAVRAVREKNLHLQKERASLLDAMGLSVDCLEPKPDCPLCGDTGWKGNKMCDCLRALCMEEQIRDLSKLLNLGEQSFDSFQLDYYSQTIDPAHNTSPYENMKLIYEICQNYALKFGRFPIRNLFLSGAPGLGKTFLSACIARSVSDQGFSVVYDTATNIFSQFETKKFQRDGGEVQLARDETRRYHNCDLLILDDLGTEMTNQFVQHTLYDLLNSRLVSGYCTVISSNLTIEETAQRYSPQISSRLAGEYYILQFFGEDIRRLKKHNI